MKVYTASKLQRRISARLTNNINNNIQRLSQLFSPDSEADLAQPVKTLEEESVSLAKQLVACLRDPYKSMLLYPLVVDFPCNYSPDSIFEQTNFPPEFHSLLSLYLHKCSQYTQLQRKSRKYIDLFYSYMVKEEPTIYELWLQRQQGQSLGQWFYSECIAGFFQMIYKNKEDYTQFLTSFLQQGITYVFVSAAKYLKGETTPLETEKYNMQRIRLMFLHKYALN